MAKPPYGVGAGRIKGTGTRQTIIAIELGKYSPSLESAFRIARVFGLGIEDVFGWQA